MFKNIYKALFVIVTLLAFSTGHGLAAECKGKSQSRCASDSSCTWVSGYTRNDGAKVKGYCRTTSRQSGQTSNKSKNKQYKEKQAKEKASKSGTSKDANSKDMKSKEKKAKDNKGKDEKAKDKKSRDKKAKDKKAKDKKAKDKKAKNKSSS